mgnify:CR=1 FL=1
MPVQLCRDELSKVVEIDLSHVVVDRPALGGCEVGEREAVIDEAGEPGSRNDHVRQISGRDIDLQKDQIAELQGGEIQSGQKGVCREFNHRRNTFLQNVPIPF